MPEPRDEHLKKIYIVGSKKVGNRTVLSLLCGGLDCAGAELVPVGLSVAAVLAEVDAHIEKMEALGG